ncbi:MAG: hypothetical protein FGM33_00875 [Candidatus Kapabacteria bacterium]|nr:hypothetical protein [Candidatus Kapabacteria bacterium]
MRLLSTVFCGVLASVLITLAGFSTAEASDVKSSERRGTMVLTEGRNYVVAFPQVWASTSEKALKPAMQLFISAKQKTKVRVRTPALINDNARLDREYTIEANKVLKIPIAESYMPTASETKTGYGITVDANMPVSVSTFQAWMGNGELARHLPVEAWGRGYYTANMYQDRYGNESGYKYRPSQILVIAARDNTVISYTPTWDTEGGMEQPSVRKGQTATVTLEKGETFLIRGKIDENMNKEWSTDLSGTFIRSTKPFGVVSGHTKVAILRYPDVLPPTGMFAAEAHFVRNNVHDAQLPVEMAGTEFVTIPTMYTSVRANPIGTTGAAIGIENDIGDVVRFIALEDDTKVFKMRSNGDGLAAVRTLRRGESFIEPEMRVPTFWKSDKPVLATQYGKSYAKVLPPAFGKDAGDNTQGHPTVEAGMPMMEYVPSADRWTNYGVFSSPEGMDNFMNIVFKTDEINKIKFDGRNLGSALGGTAIKIQGTPYSAIRASMGVGDHNLESSDPTVRWMAWTYGSLDGMQMGRAYGTPISCDLSIPCDDSLFVKDQPVCGDIEAEGRIIQRGGNCGSIFAVYPEELSNYRLEVDPDFVGGDTVVNFKIIVEDKTKDAMAVVRVVTRSGKFVEKTYTYTADKISWSPAKINFGTIAFRTPEEKVMTITNLSKDRPVNIKKVFVRTATRVFTLNPAGGFTLGPSASRDITVSATIETAPEVVDTVLVELECYTQKTTELRVRGEQPQIYVGDANWGPIPASSPGVQKRVEILNGSRVDLIVTGFQESLLDGSGKFFNPVTLDGKPLASAFPMTIPGNGKYEFMVSYSPKGEANVPHSVSVPFYSNAREVDSLAVLTGSGVTFNLAVITEPWVERVIDNVQTRQNINEYRQTVTFSNYGDQPITFNAPTIRGADAASFRIVDNGTAGSFPIQLVGKGDGQSRTVTVAFIPKELARRAAERKDYKAELVFSTNSSEQKEIAADLVGTAWQPHVKGADLDFGQFNRGESAIVKTIQIANISKDDESNPTTGNTSGTANVIITNIRLMDPNSPFEILNGPTPQNPWLIKPGEVPTEMQVRFDPTLSGTYSTPYVIETNVGTNGQAPYEPQYKITAQVQGGDFYPTGGTVNQYVHKDAIINVTVKHDENVTRRFLFSDVVDGADAARFTVLPNKTSGTYYLDVAPGETGVIEVRFTPDHVTIVANGQRDLGTPKAAAQQLIARKDAFTGTLKITDELTKIEKEAPVSGNGLYLETTNKIGDNYSAAPGGSVDVAVELQADPESLDKADMTELRVRLSYDPRIVKPRASKGDIILAGTQMEGWTIVNDPVPFGKPSDDFNSIEIDLADQRATKSPLRNVDIPAFKVKFDVFLNQTKTGTFSTPVSVYTYWNDHDRSGNDERYVLFRDIPGKITLTLPCANVRRLVGIGNTRYSVQPVRPNPVVNTGVITYGVGIAAPTRVDLFNAMGEKVATLVDQKLEVGTYDLTVDASMLSAGTYYFQVISGPFTSEPQTLTIVK